MSQQQYDAQSTVAYSNMQQIGEDHSTMGYYEALPGEQAGYQTSGNEPQQYYITTTSSSTESGVGSKRKRLSDDAPQNEGTFLLFK